MLHIRLFGQIECMLDDTPVPLPPSAQALLAYLALDHHRAHHREHLATLFWPDIQSHYARTNLRKTLWKLQQALGDTTALDIEHATIALNCAHVRIDSDTFAQAFEACRRQNGSILDAQQCTLARDAITLYRGDLLETIYADWSLVPREQYRHMYLVLLEKVLAHCEQMHALNEGIQYAHQLLQQEPAHERTHRTLMRLFYLSGNRTAALRQFLLCRQILDTEFQAAPAQATQNLADAIRQDDAETVRRYALEERTRFEAQTHATAEELRALETHLQASLNDVRRQLARLRDVAPPAKD